MRTNYYSERNAIMEHFKTIVLVCLAVFSFAEAAGRGAPKEKSNLEVLDVKLDPVHQGTNAVKVRVRNTSDQEQVFGVHIYSECPEYLGRYAGWGKVLFDTLKAKEVKWMRFEFVIYGPITDATWIQLKFANPSPGDKQLAQDWFKTIKYTSSDLDRRNSEQDQLKPATADQEQGILKVFRKFRTHARKKEPQAAWILLTKSIQNSPTSWNGRGFEGFKEGIEANLFEKMGFFDVHVDSILQHVGFIKLTGTHDDNTWVMDFVEDNGAWKIDYIRVFRKTHDWKKRLLPKMEKRNTKHFDIYYFKNSTGEKEIDRIAKEKEKGFQSICKFLGKDVDVRISMVLFEDGVTKRLETGHQGPGWATGNTIVEIYNEKQKLDPYHETVHILMRGYGQPPAVFNEGFAVYMSEQLGAPPLKNLSGGNSSIYERARELKSKGKWIELEELLTYTNIGPKWSRPPVSYPEAASFVKFLIDKYGLEKFIETYKTLRSSGDKGIQQRNVKALERIYNKPLHQLKREWEKAFSAGTKSGSSTAPSGVVPPAAK
jgi:hypothetical protein